MATDLEKEKTPRQPTDLEKEKTPGTEEYEAASSGSEVQSFDISGFPFRFNPPLHKDNRFVATNLGEKGSRNVAKFYTDTKNEYDADFAVRKGEKKTGFEGLRLGRIIMDDIAVSRGVKEGGKRYGFRFLYNPTELGGTLNVGTDFIPDQRSTNTAVLQQGIENMQLEILLNRIPDVTSGAKRSDYLPSISKEDLKQLKEQGTHYDVDFLYRCANGIHDTRWRTQTGDIGVLLPNPCRLILGPYTSRGAVVSVSVNDQMFHGNMVPILSYVNITFARFLNMAQEDMTKLETYGISQGGGSDDDSSGDSDSDPESPASGPSTPTRDSNMKLARPLFDGYSWTESDWNSLVKLWDKESNWNHKAENKSSGAYGIPQSLPGSKMKSEGSDWKTNPKTQIKWGLKYIKDRYTTPAKAWQHSQKTNWY